MEDLKSRLKYYDINIRSRCLLKLLSAIKKKTKGNVITSSSLQVPELTLILEACEDVSPATSTFAVQIIIQLVTNKYMNCDYAINKLLSCMKSPSNYQCILNGIATLLIHEFNQARENEASKYSLLFPKHPFVAALENKCDCFPSILESILECLSLCNTSSDFDKTIQVLEPIICYIICNPGETQDFDYSKILFLESLSTHLKQNPGAVQILLKYMPFMQIESAHKTAEISYFTLKFSEILFKIHDADKDCIYFVECILIIAFSVVERSITYGHNPVQAIELLMQLYPLMPKIAEKSSISVNMCFMLMSYMLKSASCVVLDKIAMLGLKLLDIVDISSTIAAVLALSVIHILPEPSIMSPNDNVKSLLSKFLGKLELIFLKNKSLVTGYESSMDEEVEVLEIHNGHENENFNLLESFTSTTEAAITCVKFSNTLDKSSFNLKLKWLKSVKQYVDSCDDENFDVVYSLVAALFIMSDEETLLITCLEALESILLKAVHFSTGIFSLLLYKLNAVDCPKLKILILNFFPKSATNKYAIPPVLGVLQIMANEPELKAHAIYLILQLWKKQDRCFPQLHTLLTESDKPFTFDSGVNEILISQAAAICEICSIEPQKHGSQFVNTLASIYNKCNDEASTPAACLAMDGIIALCKSEIMEIRSTWKALSVRLSKDKRNLISCRMYQLLALIPELKVKSYEYDKFMNESVTYIWKQISSVASPKVLCEAYKTLAQFPMDCHNIKQLPSAAKMNLKLPASMASTPFDMGKLPEDVLSYIPGYCFIDLLTSYEDTTILEGYITFLSSLVKMEVEGLPRSAYSQTRHVAKKKKVSEALTKVPEFLCTSFHSKKSPALQKNLAVGVLFCYEPPIEIGKDGFPIKRSIATQSRSYEQVLTVLLNEVNIDATEWHRCVLISSAWCSFMERAFFACEEARKAELELQRSHGHIDLTSEELNYQCKSAWLWVRERFLGIIRTNVKNTSTSHANSIFAIAGLVFTLDKFYSSLDESARTLADENDKYTIHRHFQAEYVETIICAMHPEYQPTGKVQSWLLTHLSRPKSSATYLATGCATASLCHLVPVIISCYVNEIPDIFKIMLQDVGHSSSVLSFYSGKGLGLFIKSLCEAGYVNGEFQVNLLLGVVKEMMKMYQDSEGSLSSSLIGLTICITSMNKIDDNDIKDWISSTCNIFYEKLMDEEKSSMQFEMLCVCVTAMFISAVEWGCLHIQNLEELASWIEMNRIELPQCSGISISLGMIIEAFERLGHSEGAEMKQKVLKGWFNTLTSERKPTLQKIASLNGLCSLFACGRGLMQVKSQAPVESISSLNELITVMFQILNASRDTGLQSICSWEVGRLFSVHSNEQQVESSASASYSYLGEKSILKPLMKVILSSQIEDEPSIFKYCHVLSCLKSLAVPFPRALPPINWVVVLTQFLQQNEDSETTEAALKVCMYQSSSSSFTANLISSYCNPPLVHSLPESCFKLLLDNIPILVMALPAPKLQIFLQTIITYTVKKDDLLKTQGNLTLQGILNALKQTGYKEQSKKILHDAFLSVLNFFKTRQCYMHTYLPWISEGILLLPDELQNSQLLISQNADDVAILTMIWCYLIKSGKKPLSSLRACIEEGKSCSPEQKEKICFSIYECFLNGHNKESEISQANKCISWLLETIGWIQVLEDTKSKLLNTQDVYTFLVDVCLATIIGCSGLENSYHFVLSQSLGHHKLLESLPQAISRLCQQNQWNKITDKIIDWFLVLIQSQYLKDEKYYIKLSLCSLRNTNQYQKKEIWSQVICKVTTTN